MNYSRYELRTIRAFHCGIVLPACQEINTAAQRPNCLTATQSNSRLTQTLQKPQFELRRGARQRREYVGGWLDDKLHNKTQI